MITLIYMILAALALGVLVFVHELGHYFMAKKLGMSVEIFSIGFGRPLLKWQWQAVQWQLGWLPFGGYVKITGMDFGKKEKNRSVDPYEIPNGFFTYSPLKRMAVAFAGPLANFILAFLLFVLLWGLGGREKSFSDLTQIVGWVDPQSELYTLGLRPGDRLTIYNGTSYSSLRDLMHASLFGDKNQELKGQKINYTTGHTEDFTFHIPAPKEKGRLRLLPEELTATRYLIYDKLPGDLPNPLMAGSPMEGKSLEYGDRLVWADGEYLFSMQQLSALLNDGKALLTIQRGEEQFLSRQPRVLGRELLLPLHVRHELTDWHYEMHLKKPLDKTYLLPYVISTEGYVETSLDFIDRETQQDAFPTRSFSPLERPLLPGDRIRAVDGIPIEKGYEILEQLQTHRVQLIIEKAVALQPDASWRTADRLFEEALCYQALAMLSHSIGRDSIKEGKACGRFLLLPPIEPKTLEEFSLSPEMTRQIEEQKESQLAQINKLKDPQKRAQALCLWQQSQHKLLLGVQLQDRAFRYNPSPFVTFGAIFKETRQTLQALFLGSLNPKWLSGPIGIVQVIHHGWQVGIGEALFWIAAISVNLGVLNLLPIPILDGGYICLSLWELLTRRRLKAKTLERLIIPFAVLLIGLLIFLTFQDLTRLF